MRKHLHRRAVSNVAAIGAILTAALVAAQSKDTDEPKPPQGMIEATRGLVREHHIERFAGDLQLDEAQREHLLALFDAYQQATREARAAYLEGYARWKHDYFLNRYPELDPSIPLADFPLEEREEVRGMRRKFAWRGEIGSVADDAEYMGERAQVLGSLYLERQRAFERAEREVLRALRPALREPQRDAMSRAVRRLEISKFDDNGQRDRVPTDVPRFPDMLGLIEEACAKGAELEAIAPALGLGGPPSTAPELDRLAALVDQFEREYVSLCRKLQSYSHEKIRAKMESLSLVENQPLRSACKATERTGRAIWKSRLRFVEALRRETEEVLGVDAAEAWRRRAMNRLFPILYADDTIDHVVETLRDKELADEQLAQVNTLYERYVDGRERLRKRIIDLKTAWATRAFVGDSNSAEMWRNLLDAQTARTALADNTFSQISALLPDRAEEMAAWRTKYRDTFPHPLLSPDLIP